MLRFSSSSTSCRKSEKKSLSNGGLANELKFNTPLGINKHHLSVKFQFSNSLTKNCTNHGNLQRAYTVLKKYSIFLPIFSLPYNLKPERY